MTEKTIRNASKLFDVWAVPLTNRWAAPLIYKEFGFVQVIHVNLELWGVLVKQYSARSATPSIPEGLFETPEPFPPMFTSVLAGKMSCGWKRLGNRPVEIELPSFRISRSAFGRPGVYDDWEIWSPSKGFTFVGRLSEGQRSLELLTIWSPAIVVERLISGVNPGEHQL